jgi:regulator of sirC expression with transglutaminase-like and TPR domain
MTADLQRFAELVTRDQFDLAEVSLLLAQDAYPNLDVSAAQASIEHMVGVVKARLPEDAFAEQRIQALNHYLFDELGFVGNNDDYFDPRNSYLNDVLERRTGIPITLSILYIELARRLALTAHGISFPGHFMVSIQVSRGQLVLDPFNRAEPQSVADLRQRLAKVLPKPVADQTSLDPYLVVATPRDIIARVLRNLKHIHSKAGQMESALAVMNRMLLVVPESAEELRDRGMLYRRLDCFRPALSDLQNYLRRRPQAPDAIDVRTAIVELHQAATRLH